MQEAHTLRHGYFVISQRQLWPCGLSYLHACTNYDTLRWRTRLVFLRRREASDLRSRAAMVR
jgi:hypothetical protein